MPNSRSEAPVIPDHEVLRKIGSGAYGEVWLARTVTGALRAVKVVFREDFDDERSFEREFEGVLKYEPVSRTHPGLVHVLHVGRSTDGESFYYYVMELGDDQFTGAEINPVEYEARTLRSDFKKAEGKRLDTELCIEVGERLAEGLDHLHKHGLAHRDVKPANVIFVGGQAKLADIGLVAIRDQRTFVGTEGFVPPEGPGSAQADVYSLGKVLYEIATGKDRLDFPDVPDDLPTGPELKRWHELNRIICEVCEPRLSQRQITTAEQLAEALRILKQGKRRRHRTPMAGLLTAAVLLMFLGAVAWQWVGKDWWQSRQVPPPAITDVVQPPPTPTEGLVKIVSYPQDADVLDEYGKFLGTTPLSLSVKIGDRVRVNVRKPGFRPREYSEVVPASASNEPFHIGLTPLENFTPPVNGQAWEDQLGAVYKPDGNRHVSVDYVTEQAWRRYAEMNKRPLSEVEFLANVPQSQGAPRGVVLTSASAMAGFCEWLRNSAIQGGYLTEDMEAVGLKDDAFTVPELSERAKTEGLRPFRVMVRRIEFAKIQLTTVPPGADVFLNDRAMGNTQQPLEITGIKPGQVELIVVIEGYKPKKLALTVAPNQTLVQNIELEQNQGVVFGKPWQNGIGMKFAPVAPELMACVWETRVKDYALFVKETKHRAAQTPEFAQTPDHPVVYVTRDDAVQFCKWLTERERKAERIAAAHIYRLPTDLEWSHMAGLTEEEGGDDASPSRRDARKAADFPWGTTWPLPQGEKPGNLADESAVPRGALSRNRIIAGYNDGFSHTAPVGSFTPSPLGLYDVCGNVYEWVSDNYSARSPLGVLRGGGWNTYQQENLYLGSRNAVPEKYRDNIYGFRVVLAKVPPKAENHSEPK